MPRDGSGNYSLPAGYQAVTGELIQPSQHNPPLEDIRDALTASLPRNGAAPMTGPLNLANFKINNLADPGTATDAVNSRTLRELTTTLLTLGGVAGAYTLTLSTAQTLTNGLAFWAKANVTNGTGGATSLVVTPGGGGAAFTSKAVKIITSAGVEANPSSAGNLIAGQRYFFQYDASANAGAGAYIVINPTPVATGTVAFRAHKGGTAQKTVVGAGNWEKVTWSNEYFDTSVAGLAFDLPLDRWTPPAGIVSITFQAIVDIDITGTSYFGIFKNGGLIAYSIVRMAAATTESNRVSVIDTASGTDFYEAWVMAGSADTLIYGDTVATTFAGAVL